MSSMDTTEVDLGSSVRLLATPWQEVATSRGVQLVVDTSTKVYSDIDQWAFQKLIDLILKDAVQTASRGSTVAIVMSIETNSETNKPHSLGNVELRHNHHRFGGCSKCWLKIVVSDDRLPDANVLRPACFNKLEQFENESRSRSGSPTGISTAGAALRRLAKQLPAEVTLTNFGSAFFYNILLPNVSCWPTSDTGLNLTKTIVIVDDDPDIQEFLSTVLTEAGYETLSVSDGFDALMVIERLQPCCVFTDIKMPNMDGIDLLDRIKSLNPTLPVIVFSGHWYELAKDLVNLNKADLLLMKPMKSHDIQNAVRMIQIKN